MNDTRKSRGIAPYAVVLSIAVFLLYQTTRLDYEAPAGRTGPDVWPTMVLILATLVCIYEIARRLLFSGATTGAEGALESIVEEMPGDASAPVAQTGPTYPWLLSGGVLMSVAYVALLGTLGFFLCTALYLAGFIVLGGYRRFVVTALTSVLGSIVFMFTFMKIVYVSLPLGVEPFAQVSFMLMRLMGIR